MAWSMGMAVNSSSKMAMRLTGGASCKAMASTRVAGFLHSLAHTPAYSRRPTGDVDPARSPAALRLEEVAAVTRTKMLAGDST